LRRRFPAADSCLIQADKLMVENNPNARVNPPILSTVSSEEIAELITLQKDKAEELLKKDFLSMEDVRYWTLFTKEILSKAFGPNSEVIRSIIYAGDQKSYPAYEPETTLERQRRRNFEITVELLKGCMESLSSGSVKTEDLNGEENEEPSTSPSSLREQGEGEGEKGMASEKTANPVETRPRGKRRQESGRSKVFLIPGQDEEMKGAVADFLEGLGLELVIPPEPPGQAINILEEFGENPDVDFAIALLTADDCGYPKEKPEETKLRPRQRVIFELGFLIGRLPKNLVCALHKDGLDLPSEYQDGVFIPYDSKGLWKLLVARTMKMAELDVDLNKAV
jgi:predicted nucleotide-binding protein